MKRLSPFLLLTIVGSVLAQQVGTLPAPPQTQRPEDIDVVRITTNLIQVDAVITDKNGKVVGDLKPEELEIFQDGKAQKITNFLFSSAGSSVAEP